MSRTLRPVLYTPSRLSARHLSALLSLLAPPLLFATCLGIAYALLPEYAWLDRPARYPWQLWVLTIAGTIATVGGVGDWRFHRAWVTVGPAEHRSHLLALATGGLPLFGLMVAASVASDPLRLVIPIIVVALYTATLIAYDEFVYHRRRACAPIEVVFHRLLVFGNATAWLAWLHWCLERSARVALG